MPAGHSRRGLCDAVCATVAFADMFDFPLRLDEVYRDLIVLPAPFEETCAAIAASHADGRLSRDGRYVVLAGRTGLGPERERRAARARRLWPAARRFGAVIARLPFVRMVAVSGSLAAENPDEAADLDFLVVTEPGRLWLVRALSVCLVRLARRAGVLLCPNYLLTTSALRLDHRDLFTAHELLQAVPVSGAVLHARMLRLNAWAGLWLPHRYGSALAAPKGRDRRSRVQVIAERLLRGKAGDRLEVWEGGRKRDRLARRGSSARFTRDVCEGHFGRSRGRALTSFQARCRALGIDLPAPGGARREALVV